MGDKGEFFKRVQQRDETAFAEFIGGYKIQLYKTAYTYFHNEQDALEAVQEVTYRAFKHIHKVKQPEYAKTWLIRIMINYCLDELKRKKCQIPVKAFLDSAEDESDPTTRLVIEKAVQKLKKKYQIIIILKYFHQYTLTEIADQLSLPVGTVKTQLHQALKTLRKDFSKGSDGHE